MNLSFIVACLDEEDLIGSMALTLVRQCSARQHPVFFVDNGSADQTLHILRNIVAQFTNCFVLEESQRGPGHARRRGGFQALQRSAERSWLVFLDADVWIPEDYVSRVEEAADRAEERALSGRFSWVWPPESPQWIEKAVADAAVVIPFCEKIIGRVNLCGCNHAIRDDLYRELGGHTQFNHPTTGRPDAGCDWDLGLRIWANEQIGSLNLTVTTSARRILADPVGFLTSKSYEQGMEEFRSKSILRATMPADVPEMVLRKRQYYLKHFLLKPALFRPDILENPRIADLFGEWCVDVANYGRGLMNVDLCRERASFIYGALDAADARWGGALSDEVARRLVATSETPDRLLS